MARETESYFHTNDTDTLDAHPVRPGAWSGTGVVTGDHSSEPKRYDFAALADGVAYTIRKRIGASPAASDPVITAIPIPAKTEIRSALKGRWINQGTGSSYDDIKIEDTP